MAAVGCQVLDSALGEAFPAGTLGPAGPTCKAGSSQRRVDDAEALQRLAGGFQKRYFKAVSVPWEIHSSEDMR